MTPAIEAFKKVLPRITPIDKKIRFSLDGIQVSVPMNSYELSLLKKQSGDLFHTAMTDLVEGDGDYSEVFLSEDSTRFEKAAIIKKLLSDSRNTAKGTLFSEFTEDGEENELYKSLMERGKKNRQLKILTEQKGKTLPDDNLIYNLEE